MSKSSRFIKQFVSDAFKRPEDRSKRKSITLYLDVEEYEDIERCRKVLQMTRQHFVHALVREGWEQFKSSLKDTEKKALGLDE